jgi:hypothetical protein
MQSVFVKSRLILGVIVVGALTPVLSAQGQQAQQKTDVPVPISDATRNQIEGFERSLLLAIDSAAGKLNQRVKDAFPGVPFQLRFVAQAQVTGVLLPESGAVFHVLIPPIEDLDVRLLMMNAPRPVQPSPTSPIVPTRTTDPNRAGATGLVEADPAVKPLTDPDQEYTSFMRLALIDAVLDNALALPIPSGQTLTVIAGELQIVPATPFNPRSRMLILQLKGEDLTALRENRIDREEAKKRIKESKFPN